MTLLRKILSLAVGASLFVSPIALAQEAVPKDFGVPRLAHETSAELITLGCDEVAMTDEQALLAAYGMGWQIVLTADAPEQSIMLCSPAVASSLQPLRAGQVKQATDSGVSGAGDLLTRAGGLIGDSLIYPLSLAIGWLFTLGGQIAGYIFDYTIQLMTPLFLVSQYRTNSAVVTVWPVALGIANAGFMLALVFIALTVVLQLDAGGGARRALPRLLLAALLVNFSLLIATAIIDFTRLLTRLLAVVFSVPDLSIDLITLLEGTANIGPIYEELKNVGPTWSESTNAVRSFLGMLIVWIMAGSGLVLLFNLAMRYVMLLGLLIVSPFAYLFVAMPNTAKLANLWWSTFLKYVFYAPAALLILLLAVRLGQVDLPGVTDKLTQGLVSIMFLTIGFIAASRAGKYAGIAGSAAMISLVQKTSQRGRNLMYRGARRAGGAYRGAGGALVGGRAAAYAGGAWEGARARIPFLRALAPTREQTRAAGRGAVERRTAMPSTVLRARSVDEGRRGAAAVSAANNSTLSPAARAAHNDLSAGNLSNPFIGARVAQARPETANDIAEHGDLARVQAMVRNKAMMGELNDNQRMSLLADIDTNVEVHADPAKLEAVRGKLKEELLKTIQSIQSKTGTAP